jgi:hypothetical protein
MDMGMRPRTTAVLLEKSHSMGSASVGRTSQVNYLDQTPPHLGGSGSLLFGDGADYLAGDP